MDVHLEEEEASRLKEILFPRKTRASRSTVKSFYDTGKENQQVNQRNYNIRNEIGKLKKGMQNFLDRQELTPESCLSTPRECLQIIKLMSDRLQNYDEEIQEAAHTLIEVFPINPPPISHSKFFMMLLKFNFLHTTFIFTKRRIMSNAFDEIKEESQQNLEITENKTKIQDFKKNRKKINKIIKLSSAFGKWRQNILQKNKNQAEQKQLYHKVEEEAKTIRLLSDESKLVLWLQKFVESNSDVCEILIFNSDNSTLRSYVRSYSHDVLSSVFETVEDQSPNTEDESRSKIKRIQMNLEHSLTKICLLKRQVLKIEELRRDPDYSKLDNLTSTQGLSSREMMGGAIFTPIIDNEGNSIGLIRQYFYEKPGSLLPKNKTQEISKMLERGIKATNIIENMKQKSQGIRKQYFLKSIQIMNEISDKNEVNSNQIGDIFHQRMLESFAILSFTEYTFETKETLNNIPKFIISCKNNAENQESMKMKIVSALGKMHISDSSHVFIEKHLFIRTFEKIYIMEVKFDEQGAQEHVPVNLLKNLIERKEIIVEGKQIEKRQKEIENMRIIKEEEKVKVEERQKEILNFCLNCGASRNIYDIVRNLQSFCQKFMKQSLKVSLKFKKPAEVSPLSNQLDDVLYENQQFKVLLNLKANQDLYPEVQSLKNLSNYLFSVLLEPKPINTSNLQNLSKTIFQIDSPDQSIIALLSELTEIDRKNINFYFMTQNNFENNYFVTYIPMEKLKDVVETMGCVKAIRKYGEIQKIPIEPLATVICLNGSLLIILDKYFQIKNQSLKEINQIYESWSQCARKSRKMQQNGQKRLSITKGLCKMSRTVTNFQKEYYLDLKDKTKLIKINGNLLATFIKRENLKNLHYSFRKIQLKNPKMDPTHLDSLLFINEIKKIVLKKSGVSEMFKIWKKTKNMNQKIKKMSEIIKTHDFMGKITAFGLIKMRNSIIHVNKLEILERVMRKVQRLSFEHIRRVTKEQILNQSSNESECLSIAKLNSFSQLSDLVNKKFPEYESYFELTDGRFLQMNGEKILYFETLPSKSSTVHLEFSCSSKSFAKHLVWLIPQNMAISLLEKHYLQAISKSIQESFNKFLNKSQLFFLFLSHSDKKQEKKNLQQTFRLWRSNVLKIIKCEQYKWRESFYETNVEVENLKMIEKEHKKEEEERIMENEAILKVRTNHEKKIQEYRRTIANLEVSSRNLQEKQFKAKFQRNFAEKNRAFNIWRQESHIQKQLQLNKKQELKQITYILKSMRKTIEENEQNLLHSAFNKIKSESTRVKLKQKIESQKSKKKGLENHDFNRLMTFQDQFEDQVIDDKSRDISIIPISFKQFEASSRKENIEISEEESRRMNGGSYKLNPKTLKFLKRMGKINSQ